MGPCTCLPFLGIALDTESQMMSLPEGKLKEIVTKVNQFICREECSKRELQSLIGSLSFAAKCIPAGRLFTRRLINLLPSGASGAIKLKMDGFDDLRWWREFLPKWNGTAPFLSVDWMDPQSHHLYTDACKAGFAGYFDGEWFQQKWPDCVSTDFPINLMEIVPILAACRLWKEKFRGRRILFHSDNLGVVQAWHKQGSSNPAILHIMREIVSVAASENFALSITHIKDQGLR